MHEGQARLSWLLSWDTAVPCANHDAHNALKWGALVFYPDKTALRNMFIAIESLRQSYDELVSYLPGWLGRVVLFVDCVCVESLRWLWTMRGLFHEWVEQFLDVQVRSRTRISKKDTGGEIIGICKIS